MPPPLIKKLGRKITSLLTSRRDATWEDVERFEPDWRERMAMMALYVPTGSLVVDFGCGPMWLRDFLDDCRYIGVDYVFRGPDMVVCDLNLEPFPDLNGDVAFVSGCLEYLTDTQRFSVEISRRFAKCVISYCTIEDFPTSAERKNNAWVNNFSRDEIIFMFVDKGMQLSKEIKTRSRNSIFVFDLTSGNAEDG